MPKKTTETTATVENNELIIRMPLQAPTPSKSGKTLMVATTGGFMTTSAQVDGKPVKISVNAILPR